MNRSLVLLLLLSACSAPSPAPAPARRAEPTAPPGDDLNPFVLQILRGYPLNGVCRYHWPKPGSDPWEGTTQDVVYAGRRLTHGDPQRRSYCCGLTFEVYVRALLAANGGEPVPGVSADDLHELRLRFFGDSETKERRKLVQFGLVSLGLGRAVPLEEARAGDFVQFWRHSGSGHSAIFVNWIRDKRGEIVGLTYWSSQSSTDGIGYSMERIGPKGVKRDEIYLARALRRPGGRRTK